MIRSKSIWVFLGDAKDGEAVMARLNGESLLPMICLHEDVLPLMRADAEKISKLTGKKIRLVKFTTREEVEEFGND